MRLAEDVCNEKSFQTDPPLFFSHLFLFLFYSCHSFKSSYASQNVSSSPPITLLL